MKTSQILEVEEKKREEKFTSLLQLKNQQQQKQTEKQTNKEQKEKATKEIFIPQNNRGEAKEIFMRWKKKKKKGE